MEQTKTLVNSIQFAAPKELGRILEDFNMNSFQENDWNAIAVKASYSAVISMIEDSYSQCKMYLDFGNETMDVYDCRTGEQRTLNVKQALTNLRLAREFFNNPPTVEKPNAEVITVDKAAETSVDTGWYSIDEVCRKYKLPKNSVKSRKWRMAVGFPTHQDGAYSSVRFNASEVEEWLSKN